MNRNILILLLLFFKGTILAQGDSINFNLLVNQDFSNPRLEHTRIIKYGITENKKLVQKANPISFSLSTLMFFYQKVLSPQISADCLYSPTCSEYSRQLFIRFGLLKGFAFSADRIMRCDRISATTIHQINIDINDGKVHETTDRYILKSPNL